MVSNELKKIQWHEGSGDGLRLRQGLLRARCPLLNSQRRAQLLMRHGAFKHPVHAAYPQIFANVGRLANYDQFERMVRSRQQGYQQGERVLLSALINNHIFKIVAIDQGNGVRGAVRLGNLKLIGFIAKYIHNVILDHANIKNFRGARRRRSTQQR